MLRGEQHGSSFGLNNSLFTLKHPPARLVQRGIIFYTTTAMIQWSDQSQPHPLDAVSVTSGTASYPLIAKADEISIPPPGLRIMETQNIL